MFDVFINAWKVKEIRTKLINIVMILLVVRIGAHIPLLGIDHMQLQQYLSQGSQENQLLFNIISGGAFAHMSIFAMGIGPYITSSIIMQLLGVAIPKLEQLQKEGESGRKKISQYTRVLTIGLSLLQGIGITYSMRYIFKPEYQNFWVYIVAVISLVAGSSFIMWLGEQMTAKGIGNGASMLIFANILSSLPTGAVSLYKYASGSGVSAWVKVVLLIVMFTFVIAFVVLAQAGERRLPVQYSKKMVGRRTFGGQSSFIPIKVNIAGVISIIFAISLLQFPMTISQFVKVDWLTKVTTYLNISHPFGAVCYIALIVFFTYFYTSIVFNPIEVAENMKKNGGFIPGIRPGQPTSAYITKVVSRITLVGAVFYAMIALLPVLFQWIFGMKVGFGGTTILIVVGVALDTVKQIESQLLMRHYKGFLND